MGETKRRSRIESGDRANPWPQWEVFVRRDRSRPMRHVGSVAAKERAGAHEQASRLFGREAVDVWLCPAADVDRYSTRELGSDSGGETPPSSRDRTASTDDSSVEPTVESAGERS
ncbi:Htur_1727 family rSAM-partnered candidate RiPP [Natrarchaeobius oligotrophus]|uniref:RSAM-partnered protein n=1 Tax=Natrarchaeobius chitinivorans TaxID=1679083 RepID=A0A3N6MH73_NATCH|nr:Htur_1727 family rSAM-partnered candidate RiPP [Natrarchaeobius chitinivorans]RQH00415.1 rSAM-partnered protein [Natrarchaeobius chitinivorans]